MRYLTRVSTGWLDTSTVADNSLKPESERDVSTSVPVAHVAPPSREASKNISVLSVAPVLFQRTKALIVAGAPTTVPVSDNRVIFAAGPLTVFWTLLDASAFEFPFQKKNRMSAVVV